VNGIVVSSSLNPKSRSFLLARCAATAWENLDCSVELVDLADRDLPLCDGGSCYEDPGVIALKESVSKAEAIIVAGPIYNFDINAAAKNFLELTGAAWRDKPVAILCAAGGNSSYMAPMSFANSLMLDFRCCVIPRFVFTTGDAFAHNTIVDPDVKLRIEELVTQLTKIAKALAGPLP